jgi:hypothetical protein
MKKHVVIILLLFLIISIVVISCQKSGSSNSSGKSSGDTSGNSSNHPPAPSPAITISPALINLFLPKNCSKTFTISNSGPKGSTLNYTVKDDGALGGFLDFSNPSGAIPSGSSITVTVSVKPGFTTSSPSLIGSSLVLNIYTPGASNFVKIPVSIKVKSIESQTTDLLGTWSGTWSGTVTGRNNPTEAAPSDSVKGTWIIKLQAVDTVKKTLSGTLTWNGTDAYWKYSLDKNGLIINQIAEPFVTNRTINFDATNAKLILSDLGGSCSTFRIVILGYANAVNPSDAFYGPEFMADFDVSTNTVITEGVGFSAHPYNPSNFETFVSSGAVTGKKN